MLLPPPPSTENANGNEDAFRIRTLMSNPHGYAYDGRAILYTANQTLAIGQAAADAGWVDEGDGIMRCTYLQV